MPDSRQAIKIALIGCGRMGSALLRGWLAAGVAERVYALDPAGLPEEFAEYAPNPVLFFDDPAAFAAQAPAADVYVIAVKPQIMDTVCAALENAVPRTALILSIAAGQTIASFEKRFGESQPVVRAMPNTPAAIGRGISAAAANAHAGAEQKKQAELLLRAAGAVEWVDDESLLNAVTAVSGSGPAYVFLLIEALAKAGEKAGLPAALSMTLARQTVTGAAALAESEPGTGAATLRENVTSPGGTTQAALEILMDAGSGLPPLMEKAVAAAVRRGKELAGS